MAEPLDLSSDDYDSYCTPRQLEYLQAYRIHGSIQKTAEALGVRFSAVQASLMALRAKAARGGLSPEHDMTHLAPDGFHVKGTSTLYDDGGKPRLQWVKTSIDRERQHELAREMIGAMAEELPRLQPAPTPLSTPSANLMANYIIGDLHVGMLSWPEETGEDWNLELAEKIQCAAMARLVDMSPSCEKATIVNLGDWFHFDNLEGVTSRSGHTLDTDGRYAKMARVGVKIMRQCIESALRKHNTVHVINAIGNHDDTGAMMLAICLGNIYEADPRITVDLSPSPFTYIRHGATLVGVHHGHTAKPDALPGVMAADRAVEWGNSKFRYWWTGHIHHSNRRDYAGVSVESFRTLAARDAWANAGGYRAPRDMQCILLHKDYGEVARHTCNAQMVI